MRDLAARSGVSIGTLSAVERDKCSPSIRTAERIAHGLDTSLRSLLAPGTETATTNRRGPKRRTMLVAKEDGVVRDADGTTFEVVAGKDQLAVDHPIFKSNPELRQHFRPVDSVAEMRAATKRAEQRKLGGPSSRKIPKKRTPRFLIP